MACLSVIVITGSHVVATTDKSTNLVAVVFAGKSMGLLEAIIYGWLSIALLQQHGTCIYSVQVL